MSKVRFSDLTPEQISVISNGCGPKGGFLKPPYAAFFKASCDHHDFNYWLGCTEKDRLKADTQFFECMKEDCDRQFKGIEKAYYKSWALTYFLFVRALGFSFFYYGKRERTKEELEAEVKIRLDKIRKGLNKPCC